MKAFLFDMDGVLIDSEPIHTRVKRETLLHFGLDAEIDFPRTWDAPARFSSLMR